LSQVSLEDFHVEVSKGLSKAYSLASAEWDPTVWVSSAAIWPLVEWIVWVESLRKELLWSLPFISIKVQKQKEELESVSLFECVFTNREVLLDLVVSGA